MKTLVISVIRAVMLLTGVSDAEELDQSVVERYEAYASRPLRINSADRGALVSSGLFSRYQAVTLSDYREREGDVLSVAELALVDGFSPEIAEAMSLFVSFEPSSGTGMLPERNRRGHTEAILRGSSKKGIDGKLRYSRGKVTVAVTPSAAYAAVAGRHGRVILGNLNAKFGQGLVTWSGFDMSGLREVDAFERKPSGLSPSWSFSGAGTLRGAAADVYGRRWQCSGFVTEDLLGVGFTWYGRHAQAGVTLAGGQKTSRMSADARWSVKGTSLFGELAYGLGERCAAFRGGMRAKLSDCTRAGLLLNILPSRYTHKKNGEYGIDAGIKTMVGHININATTEYALLPRPGDKVLRTQWRTVVNALSLLSPSVNLSLRATWKARNDGTRSRGGLRTDATWTSGANVLTLRAEGVSCDKYGLLSYVEAGRVTESLSAWLRLTGYNARSWNDRIYCYERDAPGSFNVPAYHGRGWAASAVVSWKKTWRRARLKIYARTSTKTGHRLQLMLDF